MRNHLGGMVIAAVVGGLVSTAGPAHAAPSNDDCSAAIAITSVPFTTTIDVTDATAAVTDPATDCDADAPGAPGVWFAYTATAPISLQIDTFGSDFDTTLMVYGGACGAETGPLDCNDNDYDLDGGLDQSRVIVTLEAGETALIDVRDLEAPFGGKSLTLNVSETPVFRVTPFAQYQNLLPAIARNGADQFLVVWWDRGFPTESIAARRYDASGLPLAPSFQVSSAEASYPDVAASDDGFVVAWSGNGDVVAQRLDGAGAPVGGEIQVAATFTYPIAVAATPAGEFMVVWSDNNDVYGRTFDATGTPASAAFQVHAYTTGTQFEADVAADANGVFTVVWASDTNGTGSGTDGDQLGVFARRFDADGTPLGGEFQVNTYTTGTQQYPAIATNADGDFLVTWTDDTAPGCFHCVDARLYDASGVPQWAPVRVGNQHGFTEGPPLAVAADGEGNFMIAWANIGGHLLSRRVAADGTVIGATPFEVTLFRDSYQYNPDVAATAAGEFVVVWNWSPYGSKYDVMGRLVSPAEMGTCTPAPRDAADCRQPIVAGKSKLTVRDREPDTSDNFAWKLVRTEAATAAELGDPLATHTYALCLYDAGGLVMEQSVGPGGTCGTNPCWSAFGTGYRYIDKQGVRGPVRKLVVLPGADGESKVIMKAKGQALDMPALPLTPSIRAQFQVTNGECWDVEYDAADVRLNGATDFKAAGP